ncbi:segregation/condensation protein A [Haladaptatus sp. AB618]|uniref:segregation/condensation protein A n=1 Tax=Haladaptatus sp. AB618 TaxID=2934173 RepID=UPI00209C6926|nr:ScpA family protein [Haladaptatus sp. AB618]MCO8253850.1 segregation/condensation protein A [Haladaptatus sp. AB618]
MTEEIPEESPDANGNAVSGDSPEENRNENDDIPLNITGHEDRDRERDESGMLSDLKPDDPSDFDDDEVEPVELLVQLAEEGEIEPWDIDIVDVTDKFLARLDGTDLRTSGRALFYASVLLRMKSDALLADDEPEEEELEPWEAPMAMDESDGFDPIASLEDEMERRLDRKSARGTPETLDELVRDLREHERGSWWKESRTYDTSDSPQGFRRGTQTLDYHSGDDMRFDDEPTESEVTGTTHDEHIETVIEDVREALFDQYEAGRTEVLYAEIEMVGSTRVMTYLALLFLAHRGTLMLDQDDLFGDLWVQDARDAEDEEPPELLAD